MPNSLFPPREKSRAKWISLGTELCILGGGTDMGKVKPLSLPVSKWFFWFFVQSGVLQIFNWSLEFSEKYFGSNSIVLCVFMRGDNAWDILFCRLTDVTVQYLLIYRHTMEILQVWFQTSTIKQMSQ